MNSSGGHRIAPIKQRLVNRLQPDMTCERIDAESVSKLFRLFSCKFSRIGTRFRRLTSHAIPRLRPTEPKNQLSSKSTASFSRLVFVHGRITGSICTVLNLVFIRLYDPKRNSSPSEVIWPKNKAERKKKCFLHNKHLLYRFSESHTRT